MLERVLGLMFLAILKHVLTDQTTTTFLLEDQGIHTQVVRVIGLKIILVGLTTMEEVKLLELVVEADSIITIPKGTGRMSPNANDNDLHLTHDIVSENRKLLLLNKNKQYGKIKISSNNRVCHRRNNRY